MSNFTEIVTDSNFNEKVIQSEKPVLVDFWAPWCGPCVSIGPMLEKLAEKYQGNVSILKMNVDENSEIPGQLGVRSIPYLAMYKGGEIVETLVGAQPEPKLVQMLDAVIK